MRWLLSLSLIMLLLACGTANAACSGSGTTWSCASGTTIAQINTSYGSASDGAVFTFADGSYTWNSTLTFSLTKGITLICENGATCNVSTSGVVFGFPTGSSSKLYRISGFNFDPASDFLVWTCPAGGCSGTISKFRMDHNTFVLGNEAHAIVLGENTSTQYVQGVIDHNTFTGSSSIEALYFLGAEDPSPLISPQGTANNMFFEDNTITVTTMTNAGLGAVDGWGSGSNLVFRYNTVTNSLVTAHELGHNGGFQNFEIYNNHVIANSSSTYPDGYRLIHHQGSGEELFFNNTLTAVGTMNSSAISITANYVDSCGGDYPCDHQPGRDFATGNLKPIYIWNNTNTVNGNKVDGANESAGTFVQNDRDYFNAVSASAQSSQTSPFNGSTGMGFGTIANRPTTCSTANTAAPDAGYGGVGYFATNAGAGNVRITWSASTDNVGVDHYKIYRDGEFIGTSGTTSYIDDTVEAATTYDYTVSAVDAADNESNQSASGAVTTTLLAGLGILYRCATTNNWVVHYAPYPYPHPLTLQ